MTTPYSYTFDDPISHTNPDGMFGEDANDGPGDLIQPTSEHFRHEHPILAAIHDVAYAIMDFTGLKDLENSVGHVRDKGVSAKDKAGHVFQAVANVFMLGEDGESESFHGEGPKITIEEANKVDRSLLDAPNKHGNAPTFKSDGSKVEIHHEGQKANGPFKEMHKSDHRLGENYKKNHPGEKPLTQAERTQFKKDKKDYWKKEYPK